MTDNDEDDQHPAACGLCGRVSTDWEDAPSMEGGQSVAPWCQPCLMAWDRGRVAGMRTAAIHADARWYVCPDHARAGGYESCCECGGWAEGADDYGRQCTEADLPDATMSTAEYEKWKAERGR